MLRSQHGGCFRPKQDAMNRIPINTSRRFFSTLHEWSLKQTRLLTCLITEVMLRAGLGETGVCLRWSVNKHTFTVNWRHFYEQKAWSLEGNIGLVQIQQHGGIWATAMTVCFGLIAVSFTCVNYS